MRPKALSATEAHEAIERLLVHPRGLVLTQHARERMQQRRITIDDIVSALTHGTVGCKPQWDAMAGTWEYEVTGRDCDGESLRVRVAIEDAIIVVTTYE